MGRLEIRIYLFITYLYIIQAQLTTRGDNDNSIDYTPSMLLPKGRSQKITTDTNRKPMFTDCENYKPSVQEEQDRGTFVITVKAEDDDPPNAGGTVTYKIVKRDGERTYFTIDNSTGDVHTFVPFDRDEPIRQKELYLTVQATDNGRPPLSDLCTFKVIVTDINDNQPVFDSQAYETQVAEDLKPNSEVMRVFAYDIDDGENSRLTYKFSDDRGDFLDYFKIDPATGVVYLLQSLATKKDTKFRNTVIVSDNGKEPLSAEPTNVAILVVSSDKQPPRITNRYPPDDIVLDENFQDFSKHLVTIEAESSINDPEVVFELMKGKTAQTNRDQTFLLTPTDKNDNSAYITLVRPLDYEIVTEYTLTVRVKNKDYMDTSINIPVKVKDVNDEIPTFIEFLKGSVVENDAPGAQAMVVRAIDKDGTSANNIVSYELLSHEDIFEIDKSTGAIKSKVAFDRENINLYHVKIRAYDNSPSALKNNSEPNSIIQAFQISIEDRNDNKPEFTQAIYYIYDISESADKAKDVGEVKALDKDTASLITYSIIDGNIGDAFMIENTTGRIKVNSKLDFEKIERYNLTVRAFDGIYEDTAIVIIYILNENDEPPVFESYNKTIELEEEKLYEGCIITMKAYDPDIKNRSADQLITYELDKQHTDFFKISKDGGCVTLIKVLDRDKPFGSPTRQVFIYAFDNKGSRNSLQSFAEIVIILIDINDNPPFLNVTEIVWYENQEPGLIGQLSADDYDSPENGPPFTFRLADSASEEIQDKFAIIGDSLYAKVMFDREDKKYYDIPINITDSGTPPLFGISVLRVIIGDVNDNAANNGTSEIFVYKYEGLQSDIAIGRVYVDDLDDWDLPDKVFIQSNLHEYFYLTDEDKGMIMMKSNIGKGQYILNYAVTEEHLPQIPKHTVYAEVTVNVSEIIEEAVRKSGSIRIEGSSIEEFIEKTQNGKSKRDLLHQHIAKIVNTSLENVDVFTVLQTPSNSSLIDVRFSAHGSPYYAPENLTNKITEFQEQLEKELNVNFIMINIIECINETICSGNCSNVLNIKDDPAVVFTNKTSFVGVKAIVEAICDCLPKIPTECFNGGTLTENGQCICPSEFEGPHCEILGIGFSGDGWAMYPTFDACHSIDISLSILPQSENGLIFYAGPLTLKHAQFSKDFISLELRDGMPLLKLDRGYGTEEIQNTKYKKLNDGATHKLRITYKTEDVQIEIDDCKSKCTSWDRLNKTGLLNINGPLQLGGMRFKFNEEEANVIWDHIPPSQAGYSGCIRNLTYNEFYYNLGAPSDQYHSYVDCNYGVMQAVTFGIDSNFLVAILVCIAILLILLLAVVVHRRQQDNLNEKDIDDTRENIINYEEEGGGECDTNYDMSVFHTNLEEKPIMKDNADVPADISGFLDNKKDNCDKDPDNLPYDDVRHYAYEGDGNSTGSLSSLASCTDEGDLKFNHLSSFGPRFRKLADMYGEDGSDEETHDGGEESWC